MPHPRLTHAAVLLSLFVLTLADGHVGAARGRPSAQTPPDRTVGVFPLKIVSANAGVAAGRALEDGLARLLVGELADEQRIDARLLNWPARAADGTLAPASFNALVAAARRAEVHGFVMATVTLVDLQVEEQGPSLADRVGGRFGIRLGGRRGQKATARLALEGGLIDSLTEQVLTPASSVQTAEADNYDGGDLGALAATDPGDSEFRESPLGAATRDGLREFATQVSSAVAALSAEPAPPERVGAPAGLRFSHATYDFDVQRAANQWAEVEVHNAATEPRSFLVRADSPERLVVGFMGSGSDDAVAELAPGAWKRVRFVVTADWADPREHEIPIHLYDVTAGAVPDAPHETVPVTVEVLPGRLLLAVEPLGARTPRLGQRYRITNIGDDKIPDFSIEGPGDPLALRIAPSVDHYLLPPGESVEVTFAPRLAVGFQQWQGEVTLAGLGQRQPLPLAFAVPAGQAVFLARGASISWHPTLLEYCTNVGGGETVVEGPLAGAIREMNRERDCERLKQLIDDSDAPRDRNGDFRDRALSGGSPGTLPVTACPTADGFGHAGVVDGDAIDRYDALWRDFRQGAASSGGSSTTYGEHDALNDRHVINDDAINATFATDEFREGLRSAIGAHESVHQQNYNAGNLDRFRCRSFDSDAAAVNYEADDEMEAFDAGIESMRALYERACGGSNGMLGPSATWHLASGRAPTDGPSRHASWRIDVEAGRPNKGAEWGARNGFYLFTTFELPHSRAGYVPHDTVISLNGHDVGALQDTIPEGRYAFPVDPAFLDPDGHNTINVSTSGVNRAHYVLATDFRLTAPATDVDRLVVAASQAEADRLYAETESINHGQPDDVVVTDPSRPVPEQPADGERLVLPVQVLNLGEQASAGGRLRVLNYDPLEQAEPQPIDLVRGLDGVLTSYVSDLARLRDLVEPVPIPSLGPFAQAAVPVEITFATRRTGRLYLVAETDEPDYDVSNNVMTVTFVAPEAESPLVGIDYPDLSTAPFLYSMVELPAVPEVESQAAVALERFIAEVPYLRELEALENRAGDLLDRLLPR